MAHSPTEPPFDVAVVLGAAVEPDGRPSAALLRRVAHGVSLYHAGRVRMLLMSGGLVHHPPAEDDLMRAAAVAAGVPEAAVMVEDRSRNTLENAIFSAEIIAAEGWRRIMVVTDHYHLPRALYTFQRLGQRLGVAVVGAAARGGLTLPVFTREMAARVIYVWRIRRYLAARRR